MLPFFIQPSGPDYVEKKFCLLRFGFSVIQNLCGWVTAQSRRRREVVSIENNTVIAVALLCIAFATLVIKIIEVSRK